MKITITLSSLRLDMRNTERLALEPPIEYLKSEHFTFNSKALPDDAVAITIGNATIDIEGHEQEIQSMGKLVEIQKEVTELLARFAHATPPAA